MLTEKKETQNAKAQSAVAQNAKAQSAVAQNVGTQNQVVANILNEIDTITQDTEVNMEINTDIVGGVDLNYELAQKKLKEIQDYRDAPAIHYSFLKQVINNDFKKFVPTVHTILGSSLDCALTTPELFPYLFNVADIKRPTGKLVDIIDDFLRESDIEVFDEKTFFQEAKKHKYGGNTYKDERILEEIRGLKEYIDISIKSKKVTVITSEEYKESFEMARKLKNDFSFSHIFHEPQIQYQFPIYEDLLIDIDEEKALKVSCKGLADWIIEYEDRVDMYDLKRTSFDFKSWPIAVEKNKYLIQMAFYHDMLVKKFNKPVFCYWIVVYKGDAVKYPVNEFDILIGRKGGIEKSGEIIAYNNSKIDIKKHILGYENAIFRYIQSQQLDLNHYNLEHFLNNGEYPNKSIFSSI